MVSLVRILVCISSLIFISACDDEPSYPDYNSKVEPYTLPEPDLSTSKFPEGGLKIDVSLQDLLAGIEFMSIPTSHPVYVMYNTKQKQLEDELTITSSETQVAQKSYEFAKSERKLTWERDRQNFSEEMMTWDGVQFLAYTHIYSYYKKTLINIDDTKLDQLTRQTIKGIETVDQVAVLNAGLFVFLEAADTPLWMDSDLDPIEQNIKEAKSRGEKGKLGLARLVTYYDANLFAREARGLYEKNQRHNFAVEMSTKGSAKFENYKDLYMFGLQERHLTDSENQEFVTLLSEASDEFVSSYKEFYKYARATLNKGDSEFHTYALEKAQAKHGSLEGTVGI